MHILRELDSNKIYNSLYFIQPVSFRTLIELFFRNVGNGDSGSESTKFKSLKERILKEKDTLFYIVIDEGNEL